MITSGIFILFAMCCVVGYLLSESQYTTITCSKCGGEDWQESKYWYCCECCGNITKK